MNHLVFVLPLSLCAVAAAQVQPGDIGITGFSSTTFGIAAPPPNVNYYNAGGFGGTGTSQAILHDPAIPIDFIVGGFGFIGRATITGPGTFFYTPIVTNPAIGTAAQLSWDGSGNLIVADAGADQVRLVTPAGTVIDLSTGTQPWGTTVNAGAYEPATGDVIVGASNALYRLPAGSSTGVLVAASLGGFVSGVQFDPCNGDILATVLTSNRLVRVDAAGTVTDEIAPGTVASPNSLDLAENGDYIIGAAGGSVFRVPPGGSATLVAQVTGIGTSASGVAYVGGPSCRFGQPCSTPIGLPTLDVVGPFTAGYSLTTRSVNHAPGVIGLAVFGLTPVQPPLDLGPILGAVGCSLYVSPDLIDAGLTTGGGDFVNTVSTSSAFAFVTLYVQHAVLEGTTLSSFSTSNGLLLQF